MLARLPLSLASALCWGLAGVEPAVAAGFGIEDYFRAQRVTELALSFDGRSIVYAVEHGLSPAEDAPSGLPGRRVFLQSVSPAGTPVGLGELADAQGMAWMPGTKKIAYLCERPDNTQVCSYDTATRQVTALTRSPDSVERFLFASDGRTLAYMSRPAVARGVSLYDRFRNDEPGIVIDSNRLSVYEFVNPARGSEERPPSATLWVRDAAGEVRKVPVPGEVGGSAGSFFWSSDGAALSVTYVSADLPPSLVGGSRTSVGIFDRASGEFLVVAKATDPAPGKPGLTFRGGEWLPGQRRFMLRRVLETDPWVSPQFPDWTLTSVEAAAAQIGSAWHAIEEPTSNERYFPRSAQRILLATVANGVKLLYDVTGDRRVPSRLACGFEGSGELFSLSADMKTAVFVGSSLTRPPEIHVCSNGSLRQLTRLNHDIAGRVGFRGREVRWKSTDGVTVHGWLLEPGTETARGPWPTITHVHGGPGAAVTNSFAPYFALWAYPFEVMASQGVAVFLPNYRGTFSYGKTIASPSGLSAEPVADILTGVESLVASGIADSSRLGISGHSHGAWLGPLVMVGAKRFQAASFAEGTPNKVVNYALMSGDLNRQVHDIVYGGSVYDSPQRYLKDSADLHFQGLRTAMLFEAGAKSLAIGMMSAPKAARHAGLPAEFVIYPRTGHNTRLTRVQRETAERNLDWFSYWLLEKKNDAAAKRDQYGRWEAMRR